MEFYLFLLWFIPVLTYIGFDIHCKALQKVYFSQLVLRPFEIFHASFIEDEVRRCFMAGSLIFDISS